MIQKFQKHVTPNGELNLISIWLNCSILFKVRAANYRDTHSYEYHFIVRVNRLQCPSPPFPTDKPKTTLSEVVEKIMHLFFPLRPWFKTTFNMVFCWIWLQHKIRWPQKLSHTTNRIKANGMNGIYYFACAFGCCCYCCCKPTKLKIQQRECHTKEIDNCGYCGHHKTIHLLHKFILTQRTWSLFIMAPHLQLLLCQAHRHKK